MLWEREGVSEGVKLGSAIGGRAVPGHSLAFCLLSPHGAAGLNTAGASLVPWHNTIISSEPGEAAGGAGRDSDFVERVVWPPQPVAACEFGMSEQEEQNKAEAEQDKSF